MAVVRQARSAPPYGLIIFAFLWVVSTAIAVLFYLQVGKSQADTAVAVLKAKDAQVAVKTITEERNLLAALVTPSAGAAIGDITTNASAVREEAHKAGEPLISVVSELSSDNARSAQRQKDLDAKLTDVQNTYDNNIKAIQADRDGMSKAVETLKAQNADLSKQLVDNQELAKNGIGDKEKALADLNAKYDSDIRKNLVSIQQLQDQLDAKDKKIADLQGQLAGFHSHVGGDLASIVDGKVLQTFPGQETVYIDLGRNDRVSIGLTFAVYDPNRGIGSNDAKGKGTIEIVELGDSQSLARITHLEDNKTILAGDVIGNVAYHKDRTRTYHFYVYGDFDVNGDGVHTSAGREKVQRMITAAGGVLDDAITTQTDFVVFGSQPGEGQQLYDSTTDQGKDLLAQREKERKKYTDMVADAKGLSIPILNENRFLSLMGYFNTTTVPQPLYPK